MSAAIIDFANVRCTGKVWVYGSGSGLRTIRGRGVGFYVGYYDADDRNAADEPKRKALRFPTLDDAATWANTRNAAILLDRANLEIGLDRKRLPLTIDEAVEEWTDTLSGVDRATAKRYLLCIARLRSHVGNIRLDQITARHLDRWFGELRKEHAEATVFTHMLAARRLLLWGVRTRRLQRSPLEDSCAKPKSSGHVRHRPTFGEHDLCLFIRACETDDQRICIWLALTTGLDRSIVQRLTAAQVDWDTRRIRWWRDKTGQPVLVPIPPAVFDLLLERRNACNDPSARLLRGVLRQGTRCSRSPHPGSGNAYQADWWVRVREAAGRPDVLFRDLRAYAAQRAIEAGFDAASAARLLGHSSPTTTMRHYLMLPRDAQQRYDALPIPGLSQTPAAPPAKRASGRSRASRKSRSRRS